MTEGWRWLLITHMTSQLYLGLDGYIFEHDGPGRQNTPLNVTVAYRLQIGMAMSMSK